MAYTERHGHRLSFVIIVFVCRIRLILIEIVSAKVLLTLASVLGTLTTHLVLWVATSELLISSSPTIWSLRTLIHPSSENAWAALVDQ